MRLNRGAYLDPREVEEAAAKPISGAVNIPLTELPEREHELPPRERQIEVVGPEGLARQTVSWLRAVERNGIVAVGWKECGDGEEGDILRLWEPLEFLTSVLPGIPPGIALDLACGVGREAVHMAGGGWDVTAVDWGVDVIQRARELEQKYSPRVGAIEWLGMHLEGELPSFARKYDLITMFRYLHRPLFSRLSEWVRPGGSVLCETFTTQHRERYGRPSRAAHVLEPAELPELLSGFEIRFHEEAWHGEAHTARIWARLPT